VYKQLWIIVKQARTSVVIGLTLVSVTSIGGAQPSDELLKQGISAYEAGNFVRAQQMFSSLVRRDPSAMNLNYLAMAEAAAGYFPQAIADFERSIRLGNDSARVHFDLGVAYLKFRHPEAGIHELELAVRRDPKFVLAQYSLGIALLDAGHPHEAIQYFENAQAQSPRTSEIWANLVRAQLQDRNAVAASKSADEALNRVPDDPRLEFTLANLFLQARQPAEACRLLEKANKLKPMDPDIGLLFARANLLMGKPEKALAVLNAMPSEQKRVSEWDFLSGESLILTGHLDAAEAHLISAIHVKPDSSSYLLAYGWLNQLRGRHTEAIGILKKARDFDPQMSSIPYRIAVSYLLLGLNNQAERASEEAIRLAPKFDLPYVLVAVVKLREHDFVAAEAALRKAISLNSEVAAFHCKLGETLYRAGNLTESRKELDRAVELDPKESQAYFWRARVFARQSKRPDAIRDLERAVALKPQYREAYSLLAQLYFAEGERDKASRALANQNRELHQEQEFLIRQLQGLPEEDEMNVLSSGAR
jgi:tetratricopeptide (TPR) repeat protein